MGTEVNSVEPKKIITLLLKIDSLFENLNEIQELNRPLDFYLFNFRNKSSETRFYCEFPRELITSVESNNFPIPEITDLKAKF